MLNALRMKRLIAFVVGLMFCMPFVGMAQNTLKEAARAAKLSPDLLNIQLKAEGKSNLRQAAPVTDGLEKKDRTVVRNGMIAIEAISVSDNAQGLLQELQAMGLTEGVAHKRLIFGYIPIDKLGQLKGVSDLRVARPYMKPMTNAGKVTSQGDQSMRSDVARQTYNVTGAGTKVGVLSDSYNALGGAAAGVASGDLPANVLIIDDVTSGEDEGRAMAEIVHDVAPGADIAFATAFRGEAGFANNILRLANAGCNVIVDDIIYLAEPFFQDGIVAQAVNQVAQAGVSYFSSAGNNGRDSYQSAFNNTGRRAPNDPLFPIVSGIAHDFGGGVVLQRVLIAPGGEFFPIFQWSDPFASVSGGAGAKTDMDIFVYYNGSLRPDLSSYESNEGFDPIEAVDLINYSNAVIEVTIALVKYSGPDPALIKWVNFGGVGASLATPRTLSGTTYGHANAEGAIATAAARYNTTPPFNTTLAAPIPETFSSAGGTPILFDTGGNPISPVVRQKPEITAPDGANTTFFYRFSTDLEADGFPNFYGTSASAPHAAGVAALIRQRAGNTYSPALVRDRLQSTTIDMDDPLTTGFDTGFDFRTGYGFIQADRAVNFGSNPLALTQPTYNCATGEITFNTTGGDGSPIVFSAIGVQRSSPTSPTGVVEPGLRADPKPIVITATQGGVTVTYTFDFASYCAGGTPTPPTSPTTGGALTLLQPTYNCTTGAITFNTSGGDGTPITYTAVGVQRSSPTSPTGVVEPGLRADPKPIVITATQGGVTVSYTFDFANYCAGGSGTTPTPDPTPTPPPPVSGGTLTLTQPTYNCATGEITFNISGGDGTTVTYSAVGIQRSSATSNTGTVEAGLRADPKPLVITATQSGVTVSQTFNFGAYCAGARVAAGEPGSGLDVKILGNPSTNEWADVEIRGAANQSLQLRLSNGMGALTNEQSLEMAGAVERYRVMLGRTPGLYLLQVSTPTQSKTVKIIRQQ